MSLCTTQNLPLVSNEDKERLKKYILEEGDIVFSRVGSIDRCTYVSKNEKGWLFSGRCIRVRANSKVNSRYLAFYFRQDFFKRIMMNISVGATMPSLNTKLMDNIPLQLPDLQVQNKVAGFLSCLDAKIELNKKIHAELEAMAKLIYDYWFVQFDFPDENGKPYKSSGGKMVYNQELKREIPEGWEVKEIGDFISVKDGTHDSPKSTKTGYKLITSKHLKNSGLDFKNAYNISEADYDNINKRSKVESGDILFSMIGNIGTIYKVEEKRIDFAIKNVALYKTSENPKYKNYIYLYLNGHDMQRYMGNVIAGSIQKFIGLGALRKMPLLIDETRILKFEENTRSIINRIENLRLENQKLSELRDWLLPMLMNGQVKVK